MKCIVDKEIDRIREKMHALIDEDYEKNYEQILVLSKKLDKVLNKALFNERFNKFVLDGNQVMRKKA